MSRVPLRLLFVTRHAPLPGEHGSGAYAFDLLRHLARSGFDITCLWVNEALNGKRGWCAVPPAADGVFRLRAPGHFRFGRWLVNPRLLLRTLLKRLLRSVRGGALRPSRSGGPSWNQLASARELRFVARWAARVQPEIVFANYYWMTPAFAAGPAAAVRAVLTHDVFHQRGDDMKARGVSVNAGEVSAGDEAAHLGRAQVVVAITEDDAAVFRALLASREIVVAPKAAEPVALALEEARAVVPGRCLFVGGDSPPNLDGIAWFLREVWPLVAGQNPAAELRICGKVCAHLAGEALPPGVVLCGVVDSLAAEYAAAEAAIVPLRAGSGLKIKLVEALAHGCACVSTSVGLQGLAFLQPGAEVLRADTAADFARALGYLLFSGGFAERMGAAGRAAIAARLAPEKTYGALAARLEALAQAQAGPEPLPPLSTTLAHAR